MHDASSAFFSCRFLYTCEEIPGPEPFVIFEDDQGEPFARTLIEACRGPAANIVRDTQALKGYEGLVFLEAPVWHRNWKRILEAGVPAGNVRTLLYFDVDPSGYWDFAKECGASLGEIFRTGRLSEKALQDVAPFLERWVAGAPFHGRFTSLVGFAASDYRTRVVENGQAIARVMAALSDDESRTTYARVLFGSEEDIFAAFVARVFGAQQYMDVLDFQPGERIVNCGVGRGWELPYFLCKMRGEGAIYNIDPTIVLESSPYAGFLESFKDRMTAFRLIAGVKDGEIELASTDSAMVVSGAGGGAGATTRYKMRSIDSMVKKGEIAAPTYLKMDVEGGEIFILQGAMETIRRHRPRLAVAIYHEPNHFWEYPLYLMEQLKDYRFYLRQYGYSRFETLLYCIPKEARVAGSARRGAGEELRLSEGVARFYLYDKAPRDFYFGKRRVLTRFEGASWEEGELKPAARIEADNLIAVQENADETVFVTDHAYEDGNRRLVFGVASPDPTKIDWRFAHTIAPEARCVPVGGLHKGAGVAVVEQKHTAIGVWEGGDEIRWPTVFTGDHDIFYVHAAAGGGYDLYLHDKDETVKVVTIDRNGAIASERKFHVGKPVRGVVALMEHPKGETLTLPALLVEAGEDAYEVRAVRGRGAEPVGTLRAPSAKLVAPALG